MREGAPTSHDRPEAGKLFPYLLEASGGTYRVHGRARFPEGARPPSTFNVIKGRFEWQLAEDGATWRFVAIASANAPGWSTMLVHNCAGYPGTSEIELVNRGIMDALWAAGCRAARVDSYQWQAGAEGAYLMTGDLVAPDCTDDCEVIDDTPKRAVVRGDLADAEACLRAVFGDALELGAWERSPGGNLVAELALGQAPRAEEVAR